MRDGSKTVLYKYAYVWIFILHVVGGLLNQHFLHILGNKNACQ